MNPDTLAPHHQAQHNKMLQAAPAFGPALVSAMLAILLYAITLGGGYIFDDRTIVVNDERMHDVHKWAQLWTQAYFPAGIDHLYRPLISSSYAIEWWVHGDRPWIFHLVNVLTNALAAAGVAELTRRALVRVLPCRGEGSSLRCSTFDVRRSTFELERTSNVERRTSNIEVKNRSEADAAPKPSVDYRNDPNPAYRETEPDRAANTAAIIAGLLFAAHPIHVEAVANIVGRAELASTAFIFLGLILLCRPLTHLRVFATIAIGIAGVLCKEQGILQPLLWLFLILTLRLAAVPKGRISNDDVRPFGTAAKRESSAATTLLLITPWTWAAYILLREHFLRFEWDRSFMDRTFQPLMLSTGWDRILMPVVLLGHYSALLIWPAHLSLDYGAEVIGHIAHAGDPYLWIGLVTITLWLIATARCLFVRTPTSRFVLFCLLSLAISYGIVGNIVTLIGTNFAERLMYLPSAFFVIIVAVLLARLPRVPRITITVILLLMASIRTVSAARDWNHPLDLYKSSLASQPKSIQAHLLLAEEYQMEKNYVKATAVLNNACDMYPNYWRVWQFRCENDLLAGNLIDAEKSLNRAIELEHNPVTADLGGRVAKARAATRPHSDQRLQ